MTNISSLSAKSGQVIGIRRSCSYCNSSTGSCLDHNCPKVEIIPELPINSNSCLCSEDKCNANIESSSSIQMQYFWPKFMLSFVTYFMFFA